MTQPGHGSNKVCQRGHIHERAALLHCAAQIQHQQLCCLCCSLLLFLLAHMLAAAAAAGPSSCVIITHVILTGRRAALCIIQLAEGCGNVCKVPAAVTNNNTADVLVWGVVTHKLLLLGMCFIVNQAEQTLFSTRTASCTSCTVVKWLCSTAHQNFAATLRLHPSFTLQAP